jgi:hypothetical protein
MRITLASALLAVAVTCLAAPKAPAQEQYMAQVDSQLARIRRTLGPRYSESRQTIMNSRRDSTPATENLVPSAGTFVFAGAGDNDVTSLKLRLFDANNVLVAADTSGSATPRFTYTVTTNGAYYRLEISLTGCRQYPCYFGVQPFQRR